MKPPSKFIRYDSKSDTLYIVAGRGMEEEFVEVAPGVNVELDAKGDVIGIEILKASKFLLQGGQISGLRSRDDFLRAS